METQLSWCRKYEHTDCMGTWTSEQADYGDHRGLFTISQSKGFDGRPLWLITRNVDSKVMECTDTLRAAKQYCESEVNR